VTAAIGTLAGKQTDPVGPPRIKRNRQSARSPVKRTPFDTTLLGVHLVAGLAVHGHGAWALRVTVLAMGPAGADEAPAWP
jgi:hypothetical protein